MSLISPDEANTVGGIVSTASIKPDKDGRYVLKAGMPVFGSALDVDRQTPYTTGTGTTAIGIVLKDIPFAKGVENVNATIITSGTVDVSYIDPEIRDLITADVQKKLNKISFVIGRGLVPREVTTKDEFLAAVKAGDNIILEKDITNISEQVELTQSTTIDLNGKKLEGSAGTKPALLFFKKGDYTIKGNGTISCKDGYAVYVGSQTAGTTAHVIIEDGTFTSATTVVHVINGKAEIKGGTYKLSNEQDEWGVKYLLNRQDTSVAGDKAVIEVTGGTFHGYNPADNTAAADVSFVKAGYKSVKDGAKNTWTVVKA